MRNREFKSNLTEISNVFKRTKSADLDQFVLNVKETTIFAIFQSRKYGIIISMDLLGKHRARSIDITCPEELSQFFGLSVELHPQAFSSSKNTTKTIYINFCQIMKFNFDFLTGFDELARISLSLPGIRKPKMLSFNFAFGAESIENCCGPGSKHTEPLFSICFYYKTFARFLFLAIFFTKKSVQDVDAHPRRYQYAHE